jgi:hypothetical protein
MLGLIGSVRGSRDILVDLLQAIANDEIDFGDDDAEREFKTRARRTLRRIDDILLVMGIDPEVNSEKP